MDGEVVVERRRRWTPTEKAALMAEMETEAAQVLAVTQRYEGRRAVEAALAPRLGAGQRPGPPTAPIRSDV